MRGCLRFISKTIALFFVLLLIISSLVVIPLFNIQRNALNAEAIKDAVREQQLYARLPALVADQLSFAMVYNPCAEDPTLCEGEGAAEPEPADPQGEAGEDQGGPPDFFQNMGAADWEALLGNVLPPGWAQSAAEDAVDQLFAILEGQNQSGEIVISLAELKTNLSGESGFQAALNLIQAQPPCDEEMLANLALDNLVDDGSDYAGAGEGTELPENGPAAGLDPDLLLECSLPPELLETIQPQIEQMLAQSVEGIPQESRISLGAMAGPEQPGSNAPDPLEIASWVLFAIRLSPLLPLLMLALVALFGVRSLKGWMRWWGVPLLMIGGLSLLAGLAAMPLIDWLIRAYAAEAVPGGISPDLVEILINIVRHLASSISDAIRNQGLLIGAAGLGMLVASFFFKSPTAAAAAAVQDPLPPAADPSPDPQADRRDAGSGSAVPGTGQAAGDGVQDDSDPGRPS